MSSAADTPQHRGWFQFQLTNKTLIEFSYHQDHEIVDKPPESSTTTAKTTIASSDTFFYIKLSGLDATRRFYFAEDTGEGLSEDEAFPCFRTIKKYVHHDDDVQKNLTNFLHDNARDEYYDPVVTVSQEALTAFMPILSSFACGVTPVNIGDNIVRPFVLDVRFVEVEYYDPENNEVEQMEFESLVSAAQEEEEEEMEMEVEEFHHVDSLEKVRYEERSGMSEKCIICYEEFEVGLDVTLLPCLHVYHDHCVRRWFRNKQSCPMCRYEL